MTVVGRISLITLDNRLNSPSYVHDNSFTDDTTNLTERVRQLEARMSMVERRRSPSRGSWARNEQGKHLPRKLENTIEFYGPGADINPGSMLAVRHVVMSLTERLDEQLNRLDMRISKLETTIGQTSGENGATSRLNNEVRILKATTSALELEVNTLSRKIDEQYNRLTMNMDALASRLRGETDSKLAGLSQKLLKCSNQCSPGLSLDPANPNDNVDPKWTKLIEDRYKHMLDGLQARIDEQLKVLHVRLQQVGDAQSELRAKLDMEQFGFRKLCSEVAQDVSSKLIQPDDRKQPKPWQTNQLPQWSADDDLVTNHTLILQKLNSIRYKISAEISLLKCQWHDDVQRLSSQCRDIEDKISSVGKRANDDKLELEGVLSAEIKTRGLQYFKIRDSPSGPCCQSNDSTGCFSSCLVLSWSTLRSGIKRNDSSEKTDSRATAIKDIYRRLEELNEVHKRQYNNLHKEVRAEADRLNKSRENLHKTLETKFDELKRQFALLHNEMVNVQTRISQQMNVETSSEEQASEIREVAESLLAVKLALAMKIKSLELKKVTSQICIDILDRESLISYHSDPKNKLMGFPMRDC
ncbi:hypothetical protein CSKR_104514 [Clonorchis sinensis]|uniref:Uncharacterized protein n=1 Tax=Clonorchis sinensis TaxID=79923 RepID=A0A419Q6D3_CLOSI|nr:hypothetical protein CSKR_104514 [Clonorchis sinensis]